MISTDEQALRRRLHEEISRVEAGPVPAEAVIRRGAAIRARRRTTAVSGAAVLAAVIAVAAQAGGAPAKHAPVLSSGHTVTLNAPDPRAPGGVFASGTADGRRWRLAAQNIGGRGAQCLPAVLLDGGYASLLAAGAPTATTVGDPSFLGFDPGRTAGIGFGFIQLPADVTKVTADLPGGAHLGVSPVTVIRCGERFRLAGFGFTDPRRGVTGLTVRFTDGATASFYPSPGLFAEGLDIEGGWNSPNGPSAVIASGVIGSGTFGRTPWHISMTLAPTGQCYTLSASLDGTPFDSSDCGPIEAPPAGVPPLPLLPLPVAGGRNGYAGLASPRAAYLMARLSDGQTRRLVPVDIGGRKYFGLALGNAVTLARLTVYDARGHAFGTATSAFAVK